MRFRASLVFSMILTAYGTPLFAHARKVEAAELAAGFVRKLEVGEYMDAWALLSPDVRNALGLDALRQAWESLTVQLGDYRSSGIAVTSETEAVTRVIVPLAYEHGRLDAEFSVGAGGRIIGLHFRPSRALQQSQSVPSEQRPNGVEREVLIGGENGIPGTLFAPLAAPTDPVPAVLLVPGSGAQDRDGKLGENRPYADIAHGLAALDIASLRFDKRTLARPQDFYGNDITLDQEVGEDVIAALALLGSTPGVDSTRIFIYGHSLGGIAAAYAAKDSSVAGLILFATPSRSILDLLVDQVDYIGNLDGKLDADESAALKLLKGQVARLRSGDMKGTVLEVPASYWADLERRNVVTTVLGLHKPVLLLQGGRDYQVTATDWKIWQDQTAGHPGIALREYPSLNHLGISGSARSTPDEYLVSGAVDKGMIQDIADWITHGAPSAENNAQHGALSPSP